MFFRMLVIRRPTRRIVDDRVHRQAGPLKEVEVTVGLFPVEHALFRLDRAETSPDACPDDLRPRLHEGLQALLVVRVRVPGHVVVEAGAELARRSRRRDRAPADDGKARLGHGLGRLGLQRGLGEPRSLRKRPPHRQPAAAVRREVARRIQRKGRSAEAGDVYRPLQRKDFRRLVRKDQNGDRLSLVGEMDVVHAFGRQGEQRIRPLRPVARPGHLFLERRRDDRQVFLFGPKCRE